MALTTKLKLKSPTTRHHASPKLRPIRGKYETEADLTFPESIVFGYSYRPNEKWNIEFNVDWTNWDRVDDLTIEGLPAPRACSSYELNWESAFIWELGVTRYFDNGWNVSAGYTYVESAVPDQGLLPIVPDSDRHFFALGVGRDYGNFYWQATYQYTYADERGVSGNDGPLIFLALMATTISTAKQWPFQ